jgi:hypothetical protein
MSTLSAIGSTAVEMHCCGVTDVNLEALPERSGSCSFSAARRGRYGDLKAEVLQYRPAAVANRVSLIRPCSVNHEVATWADTSNLGFTNLLSGGIPHSQGAVKGAMWISGLPT